MPTGDPICPSCGSMTPHDFVMCSRPHVSFRQPSLTPSRRDFNAAKRNGDVIERYDPTAVDEDICPPVRSRKPVSTRAVSTVVNRVFYIDVSNVKPGDIPNYMAKVKDALTPETNKNGFVESAKSVGLWEDFFIPVRGVIPGYPNLWRRILQFFVGREPQEISATRIELHQVEVSL